MSTGVFLCLLVTLQPSCFVVEADFLQSLCFNLADALARNAEFLPHFFKGVVHAVHKAVAHLEARPARKDYPRKLEIRVGRNRRRQCNLFDPDGMRVELMEDHTVDGMPSPLSTLPMFAK